MTLRISVDQAAITSLANYLDANLSDVVVYDRWPEADVVLERAITIIRAGKREIEYVDPDVVGQTNINDTTATYTWLLGFCTLPVQLDVWATSDVERDDLLARLDDALHVGAGPAAFSNQQNPVEAVTEVKLDPDSGIVGYADFRFDNPDIIETPDAVTQREYRATYMGDAFFPLTVKATSARLAQIILQQKLSETAPLGDDSIPVKTTTIDSSS